MYSVLMHVHTHEIRLHTFERTYSKIWIRGMEQRYGTDPSNRYGTEVWNGGMERVWSRTLFRTLYFDLHPYVSNFAGLIILHHQTNQSNTFHWALRVCNSQRNRHGKELVVHCLLVLVSFYNFWLVV